jgi:hypothetical protein
MPRRQRWRPAPSADATISFCDLLIRDLVRSFADLPRQVVVRCFQSRSAGRSLRHRLAKVCFGFPRPFKSTPSYCFGQLTMIGMGRSLPFAKCVAL